MNLRNKISNKFKIIMKAIMMKQNQMKLPNKKIVSMKNKKINKIKIIH